MNLLNIFLLTMKSIWCVIVMTILFSGFIPHDLSFAVADLNDKIIKIQLYNELGSNDEGSSNSTAINKTTPNPEVIVNSSLNKITTTNKTTPNPEVIVNSSLNNITTTGKPPPSTISFNETSFGTKTITPKGASITTIITLGKGGSTFTTTTSTTKSGTTTVTTTTNQFGAVSTTINNTNTKR